MPHQIPSEEYQSLLARLARAPEGLAVRELLAEVSLSKRTLQRRLDQLVGEGKIQFRGEARARRYFAKPPRFTYHDLGEFPSSMVQEVSETEENAWLSEESLAIRKRIRRPVAERTPVGYRLEFLDAYEPNETHYLPRALRRELMSLGQMQADELPAGTYLRRVMGSLLVDLSWNSSRLEGNTYSLLETERLLKQQEYASGKSSQETQMVLNHKAAIEMLSDQADELGFTAYTICSLHSLLADNLLADSAACGRVRSCSVGISGTVFYPLEIPQRIEEQFHRVLEKASRIQDPFEQSFFVMVHLPYLQPFEDVNKRVSRLAANIPMVRHNLCPLSFIDVDRDHYLSATLAVYELNQVAYLRDVFAWAYRRSCARYSVIRQTLGDPDPFRLKYRAELSQLVRFVVQDGLHGEAALAEARKEIELMLPAADREQMERVLKLELTTLHMGNIARFRLRPSEFTAWNAAR